MKNTHNMSAGMFALAAVFGVAVLTALDQLTKLLAAAHLKGRPEIPLIKNVLELRYLYPENRGIAFGMFQGSTGFFAVVTVILAAAIVYAFVKIPKNSRFLPLMVTGILMMSGALGNFIDRVFRGYVIDFIYFSLIDFPVFNLADVYVVCSGILLVIFVGFKYKDEDFLWLSPEKKKS